MIISRSVFLFFISFLFSACTTLDSLDTDLHPISKIFHADFQRVWRATILALEDYPIASEDNEKGSLQTEKIPDEKIWQFPAKQKKKIEAAYYTLHIQLVKGKLKKRSVVKVSVLKKIKVQKGFIEGSTRQASDGLEEKAILYRIARELKIEQGIRNYK